MHVIAVNKHVVSSIWGDDKTQIKFVFNRDDLFSCRNQTNKNVTKIEAVLLNGNYLKAHATKPRACKLKAVIIWSQLLFLVVRSNLAPHWELQFFNSNSFTLRVFGFTPLQVQLDDLDSKQLWLFCLPRGCFEFFIETELTTVKNLHIWIWLCCNSGVLFPSKVL